MITSIHFCGLHEHYECSNCNTHLGFILTLEVIIDGKCPNCGEMLADKKMGVDQFMRYLQEVRNKSKVL